jgi:hypothetical protein
VLDIFDMSTAYPLVLAVNAATSETEVREAVYRLVESYVVRRAICGLTPKNYNTIFLNLATIARESGGSLEALSLALAEYSGSSNIFPNDEDLRQAFLMQPVYQNIPRRRLWYIFSELEFASRDEYSEAEGLKEDLEIEHILPQTWYEHWPLSDGSKAPADLTYGLSDEQRALVARRQGLIHTLGNLTLLTKPANIEVLNYAFDPDKKARLRASLLQMNQNVAAKAQWNEDAIGKRAKCLAELHQDLACTERRKDFGRSLRNRQYALLNFDVRFTPKSGHSPTRSGCLLWAKSGHRSGWPQHCTRAGILRYFECGIPRYGNSLRTSV